MNETEPWRGASHAFGRDEGTGTGNILCPELKTRNSKLVTQNL